MEITEDQRRRAEANRLAALEKRKRAAERSEEESWSLVKCGKVLCHTTSSSSLPAPEKNPALPPRPNEPPRAAERFRVVLEICSPDEFAVSPVPLPGFAFPGTAQCFQIVEDAFSLALPFQVSESQGSQGNFKAFVFKLIDYNSVLKILKKLMVAELQYIPYTTLLAIRTFQDYAIAGLIPCWKEHYSEGQVDEMFERMPRSLRDALLPFQLEGVRFGLRRGARCLIADEMGLGKTLQDNTKKYGKCSLFEKLLYGPFGLYALDGSIPVEQRGCMELNQIAKKSGSRLQGDVASEIASLFTIRPGLLGKDKYEFARNYCIMRVARGQGNLYKDFSKSNRLEELNVLLRQYVMIRRLKEHVLAQLPPKRRQIILLQLKSADISLATRLCGVNCVSHQDDDPSNQSLANGTSDQNVNYVDEKLRNLDVLDDKYFRRKKKMLSFQEVGIAKLSGFREWFYDHVAVRELEDVDFLGTGLKTQKMLIFGHHIKVLDGIQEFVCEKGIQFVRIDGKTLPKDRQAAVECFRLASEVFFSSVLIY
ncbi:SWI/SNF-related matrix-associated actin-dependent regulator of chromatin subfamily A-like protein 1 [Apostasia shenzhenica]|uniref:SWI/SNF-related matrix-associated actin-dependent regulator of chromatin subfamily A-like protein 1 n=1 Tax=Apostasia shenzhenica TaxID=1088818 RepID=A0A2I0A577_9ASPA|nr:SWI/SNF-related matrix-associated actin-dependent regulator of chromatin subfamily A-like protein 1 [Apostasia shenzhenica]